LNASNPGLVKRPTGNTPPTFDKDRFSTAIS